MGSGSAAQASSGVAPVGETSGVTQIHEPTLQPETKQDRLVLVQRGDALALNIHMHSEVNLHALYQENRRAIDAELAAIAREYLGMTTDIVISVRPGSLVARIVGRFWRSWTVKLSEMARRIRSTIERILALVEVGALLMIMVGFQVIKATDAIDEMFDRIAKWFKLAVRDAFAQGIKRMLRRDDGYGEGGVIFV